MFKRSGVCGALCVVLLAAGGCQSNDSMSAVGPAAPAASVKSSPIDAPAAMALAAHARGLVPTSLDTRGRPRMLHASANAAPAGRFANAHDAALAQLGALDDVWGVGGRASDLVVSNVHPLAGGASVVTLAQRAG